MNAQLNNLATKLKLGPAMFKFWKKEFWTGAPKNKDDKDSGKDEPAPLPAVRTKQAGRADTTSSLTRVLGGDSPIVEEFYFPPDIIGGMCPQVPGMEEDTAWNAAAEACDSERVHIVWSALDGYVWYLAIRSGELSAHPNSWCPFAAFLPGMKDSQPMPCCYTYYGEEIASMMSITKDGLHIYRGTNPIVRAKAERTSRELGNAAIIDLIPDRVNLLTAVPWYSISLFEERARRVLATATILLSLSLTGLAFLVWLLAGVSLVTSNHNLAEAQSRTEAKTVDLLNAAQNLNVTPVREALTKFAELNEGLLDLNGYLEVYAIKGGKVRWRATVPTNVTADRINALGGKTIETKPNGTLIGNAAEIEYEASKAKK